MMKIDSTVRRETKYIAIWVFLLSLIMQAVFLIIGKWDYTVLLGNVFSGAIAVLNFLLMGITVQKAVEKSEKDAAAMMKASQSMRSLLLFVVVVLGIALPFFNGFAAVIPMFFPRIAIAIRPFLDRKKALEEVKKDGE